MGGSSDRLGTIAAPQSRATEESHQTEQSLRKGEGGMEFAAAFDGIGLRWNRLRVPSFEAVLP
jgi:hypothetical protein